MANKLVRFVLSVAAITPLFILQLPTIAQSSSMHKTPMRGATSTSTKAHSVTTSTHSSVPSSQMSSASGNGNLSRYSPVSAPILKIGSQGKPVKDVQAFLKREKLYTGSIDGVFGQQMRSSIIAFQRSQHLNADGRVGQKTWAAMIKSA